MPWKSPVWMSMQLLPPYYRCTPSHDDKHAIAFGKRSVPLLRPTSTRYLSTDFAPHDLQHDVQAGQTFLKQDICVFRCMTEVRCKQGVTAT